MLAETFGLDWHRAWQIKETLSDARNTCTACDFAMQAKEKRGELLRACRLAAKTGVPRRLIEMLHQPEDKQLCFCSMPLSRTAERTQM